MKVAAVKYGRVANLGHYETERIEVEVSVTTQDTPEQVLQFAKDWVHGQLGIEDDLKPNDYERLKRKVERYERRWNLKTLLAPVLVTLLACGPVTHVDLTPAPTVAVATAVVISEVNAVAGQPILGYGVGYWVVEDLTPRMGECGSHQTWDLPATSVSAGEIRIVCPEQAELVLIHEIGHAFGLKHVNDPASVMHTRMVNRTTREAAELLVAELRQKRLLVDRQ